MRIGLMVPASNTTMEGELAACLPPGARVIRVGIPRAGGGLLTRETMPAYRDAAIALARAQFGDGQVDAIAYGCTAAGFIAGPEGDAELARLLAEATGVPVVTTARAMVEALADIGARRIAVVTPYAEAVNARLAAFLEAGGIAVARLASLGAADLAALCALTAEDVRPLAEATMGEDCDALFIGCSQLPTAAILPGLAARFGRPALSSISATGWGLRRLPIAA